MSLFSHNNKILHCSHHKAGSYWVAIVLLEMCKQHGLNFVISDGDHTLSSHQQADVIYDNHSATVFDMENYVGSHLIRDLRDIIISGYFYHLWTHEYWVHLIREDIGMTYQEKLKSLSVNDGIMFEMKNQGRITAMGMRNWNYPNPRFLEVRYEDMIANPDISFTQLFNHWGVLPEHMEECLEISRKHHMTRQTGRKVGDVDPKSHMRSGQPGQWKMYFTPEHIAYFKENFGDILIKLGYEKSTDWGIP